MAGPGGQGVVGGAGTGTPWQRGGGRLGAPCKHLGRVTFASVSPLGPGARGLQPSVKRRLWKPEPREAGAGGPGVTHQVLMESSGDTGTRGQGACQGPWVLTRVHRWPCPPCKLAICAVQPQSRHRAQDALRAMATTPCPTAAPLWVQRAGQTVEPARDGRSDSCHQDT